VDFLQNQNLIDVAACVAKLGGISKRMVIWFGVNWIEFYVILLGFVLGWM